MAREGRGAAGQSERRGIMICSQCGNNVAEGAAACPGCGAPQSTGSGANVRVSAVSAEQSGPGMAARPGGPYAAARAGRARPVGRAGRTQATGRRAGRWVPGPLAPAFNLDLKRLTRNDRMVGGATIVFVISLFLPWFTVSDGVFSEFRQRALAWLHVHRAHSRGRGRRRRVDPRARAAPASSSKSSRLANS